MKSANASRAGATTKNAGKEQTNAAQKTPGKSDAVTLLKADHRKVEQLFAQFESAEDEQKKQLVQQICKELVIHTKLEEEIFYPACRDHGVEDDLMNEAQVEHDGAKVLIADLMQDQPGDQYLDAKVKTLSEYIKHHVGEEEKPRSGIFAKAQKAGVDMAGLGQKLQARKQELMEDPSVMSQPPEPRSFHTQASNQKEFSMNNRYSNDRDRDDRGRFMSDDDDRGGRGGYSSRGSSNRERDDQGRFMSDDGDNRSSRGGYSSRSRDDDDDYRGSSRGRGHGGWFGDSEGHSQAAQSRSGSSRSREDDDDYRGSSRGGRGQGGYSSGGNRDRDEQGRFMSDDDNRSSSRGSYSSRSRDDDDDDRRGSRGGRGHGGWFGDPEGHSEAAERGWESRGSSSRSRDDDDDDRRSSRGGSRGGHGGWFGDSRGHSRAAEKGWQNR